uniref:Uncharacterized protein n=1 Tax=Dunaliella tertiolecta TaxID=3047 RepID=A0A7S3QMS6_DUNTE|mmetsp:Transcript_3060/g.8083  ORF Transcript_3060/g.8083 Transcript_3060/m.8083 type:complete len:107 (+) Transcript_3060:2862-3182(+)
MHSAGGQPRSQGGGPSSGQCLEHEAGRHIGTCAVATTLTGLMPASQDPAFALTTNTRDVALLSPGYMKAASLVDIAWSRELGAATLTRFLVWIQPFFPPQAFSHTF